MLSCKTVTRSPRGNCPPLAIHILITSVYLAYLFVWLFLHLNSLTFIRLQLVLLATVTVLIGYAIVLRRTRWYLLWTLVLMLLPGLHLPRYWHGLSGADLMTSFLVPNRMPRLEVEFDLEIASSVLAAYLVLLLGIWLSLALPSRPWRFRALVGNPPNISVPIFMSSTAISLVLAWVAAPSYLIWERSYAAGPLRVHGLGLTSAWLISISLAAFLVVRASIAPLTRKVALLRLTAWLNIAVVSLYFGLLRGDREYLLFVGALIVILLSSTWEELSASERRRRFQRTALLLVVLVASVALVVVGRLRSTLYQISRPSEILERLLLDVEALLNSPGDLAYGTWSGVSRSLFLAIDSIESGVNSLRFGHTYIELLVSIPPGALFQKLGLERPIDYTSGPATEFYSGTGGLHFLVTPYINFGLVGVFAFGLLVFYFWRLTVESAMGVRAPAAILVLVVLTAIQPSWLWYGDKYLINSLLILAAILGGHRLAMTFTRKFGIGRINL